MDETNIVEFSGREVSLDPLTELLRTGAQDLIQAAVQTELAELMDRFVNLKTPDGRAGVVRNGSHPAREIQTGVGPVTVEIPKVRSRTGKPVSFRSALVPPYVRKTKTLQSAIPWLYLKGGPVTVWCRSTCSFKPPSVRKRPGFSSPMLSGVVVDCRNR